MSEEHTEQEVHICRGCCGAGENEVKEPEAVETEDFEAEDLELKLQRLLRMKPRKRSQLRPAWTFRAPILFIHRQPRNPSKLWIMITSAAMAVESVQKSAQQKLLKWGLFMRLQPGLMRLR